MLFSNKDLGPFPSKNSLDALKISPQTMNINPVSIHTNDHDQLLKILRIEFRKGGEIKSLEKTFCIIRLHDHPEKMPAFFRELADQIEEIVS